MVVSGLRYEDSSDVRRKRRAETRDRYTSPTFRRKGQLSAHVLRSGRHARGRPPGVLVETDSGTSQFRSTSYRRWRDTGGEKTVSCRNGPRKRRPRARSSGLRGAGRPAAPSGGTSASASTPQAELDRRANGRETALWSLPQSEPPTHSAAVPSCPMQQGAYCEAHQEGPTDKQVTPTPTNPTLIRRTSVLAIPPLW